MNKAKIAIQIVSVIIITLLFYYLFSMQIYAAIGFLIGGVTAYLLLCAYSKKDAETPFYFILAVLGGLITYFFYGNLMLVSTFLIGANITAYYLNIDQTRKITKTMQLLNVIVITGVILFSGIEKFRGFNKIALEDIQLTIPLIILIVLSVYFLIRLIQLIVKKAEYAPYLIVVSIIALSIGYYLLSFGFYRETGISTIFVPLLFGLTAAVIDYFFTDRNIFKDLAQIFLLLVSAYAISGILGIALAIMSGLLWKKIILLTIQPEKSDVKENTLSIFSILAPLLFLFAAIELQENEGQIMRFNLSTGFQAGWLFISIILFEYAARYYKTAVKWLEGYALSDLTSIVITVFTILLITVIMKFGHSAALAALVLCGSIYLFLADLIAKENQQKKSFFVVSLTNVVGVVAFLILAGI